jgi:hypothetical protein
MLLKNREQTILKLQAIDDEGPGTVLRDLSTALSYIGSDGIQVSGKHHFLPLKRLADLNATMVKPVELALR